MGWLPHEVSAEPAGEPVSLEELKAWTQVDADDVDFDTELAIQLKGARRFVEQRAGIKLVTQTVIMRCSSFCDVRNGLSVAPLQSIMSLEYLDENGVEQTLDPTVYEAVLTGRKPFIRLKPEQSWPAHYCAPDAIRVTAVAGFGAAAVVPEDLKIAIALIAADWFRSREDTSIGDNIVASMPNSAKALIANYRTFF